MRWWDKIPKKLTALAIGLVVQLIPGLDDDTKEKIRDLVIGFMGAQGLADVGRAVLEAKQSKTPPPG
jgi:hypothetical protein